MNMAFNEESTPAQALVACRVCLCLATAGKMYCFETAELKKDFFNITGLEVTPSDGLPQHMCHVCRGLLRKATEFRNKCHSTHQLLSSHPVTLKFIQNIHGQPSQNMDVASANFDSNLQDLQLDAERDIQNHLNKEKSEEKDKYFQSDVQCDIQNHVNIEVRDITLQLDKENDIQNHVNKEDPESDLQNSQDDTDMEWATDDNLNDNDQSDDEYTTVVDDELDSIVDKADDETKSIPLGEITSVEMDTMDIEFTSNGTTVEYSKMLHQYMQEKYVSKTLEPDSLVSKRIEFYNFLKQKYDYDGYMDEADEHSLAFQAKKYNLEIEYISNTEQQIDNLRTRMYTDKYKQAKFKCTDCYTGFATKQRYKKHRERHDSAEHGSFICEVCKQRYLTKGKFRLHRRLHGIKLTCNQCGQIVRSGRPEEHFETHNSGSKYECEHCPYVSSKKTLLGQHVRNNHGTVPCGICHFMMLPRGVDSHMKRQHAKTFTCSSCCKVFNAYTAIAKHIHTSPGGVCCADAWPCTKCGRNYRTESDLREHIDWMHRRRKRKQQRTVHTGERTHRCSQCEKTYTSRAALYLHGKINHEYPYKCTICSKKFLRASDIRTHMNTVHKMELSLETQRKIKEKEEQKQQRTVHTGERTHRCSQCEKTYTSYSALYNHCRIKHEYPYKCTICSEKFPGAKNIRTHMNTVHKMELPLEIQRKIEEEKQKQRTTVHTGERSHHCSQCEKTYTSYASLYNHCRIKHEYPYKCTICSKKFPGATNIRTHMNTVHKMELSLKTQRKIKEKEEQKQPHRCSQCEKTYTSYSALYNHCRIKHEYPYKCTICSEKFPEATNIRTHMNTVHKMELPLEIQRKIEEEEQKTKRDIICEWCAKLFSSINEYRYHAKTHTRAHACPACPRTFRTMLGLKQHAPVHAAASAYQCPQCGRTSTTNSSLKKHIKVVHENIRPHECPVCSKKFGRSTSVKEHMINVHKMEPPRDSGRKNNAKGEKKVGGGVKKVGGGVKKVGRGVKKVGGGVKKVGKGVKNVGKGVKKVGKGVKRGEGGV